MDDKNATAVLLDEQPLWLEAVERILDKVGFTTVGRATRSCGRASGAGRGSRSSCRHSTRSELSPSRSVALVYGCVLGLVVVGVVAFWGMVTATLLLALVFARRVHVARRERAASDYA